MTATLTPIARPACAQPDARPTPLDLARAEILAWLELGWSLRQLATMTQIDVVLLQRLHDGSTLASRDPVIIRTLLHAQPRLERLRSQEHVPALGTRRRLQSLHVSGLGPRELCTLLQISPATLQHWLTAATIPARCAYQVAELAHRRGTRIGVNRTSAHAALNRGWRSYTLVDPRVIEGLPPAPSDDEIDQALTAANHRLHHGVIRRSNPAAPPHQQARLHELIEVVELLEDLCVDQPMLFSALVDHVRDRAGALTAEDRARLTHDGLVRPDGRPHWAASLVLTLYTEGDGVGLRWTFPRIGR